MSDVKLPLHELPSDRFHSAMKTLFNLRAAIVNEKVRVLESADVVQWSALTQFTEYAEQLHKQLMVCGFLSKEPTREAT